MAKKRSIGVAAETLPPGPIDERVQLVVDYLRQVALRISVRSEITAEASEDMPAGACVAVDEAGRAVPAVGGLFPRGVTTTDAEEGEPVNLAISGVLPGIITEGEFGRPYWLAPDGSLTDVEPTATGALLVIMGRAISETELHILIRDYGVVGSPIPGGRDP